MLSRILAGVRYALGALFGGLLLVSIWGATTQGVGLGLLFWLVFLGWAVCALPVRSVLWVRLLAWKHRVPLPVAAATHRLVSQFDLVAYRSGIGEPEAVSEDRDDLRDEGTRDWMQLARWVLACLNLIQFRRTVYVGTPTIVRYEMTPERVTLALRRGNRKHDAHDLAEADTVRHLAQSIRECLRREEIAVRAHPKGSLTMLTVQFTDPLTQTRYSEDPKAVSGPVRLGVDEEGHPVLWSPEDAAHVALQGQTRSGKSALLYGLLGGLAGRQDCQVAGLDPTGVLLLPWYHAGNQHIATPSTVPEGMALYEYFHATINDLVEVMDQRIMQLAESGKDKIDQFSAEVPVMVVVLEEYPGLLRAASAEDAAEGRKPAERVAGRIEAAVGRLVAEGAKAGIRVLLLGQRLSAKALDTDSRSNFGVRISLRVDSPEALGMLHSNAHEWAPEVAVFEPGMGLIERPDTGQLRFRSDLTTYETYTERVKRHGEISQVGA